MYTTCQKQLHLNRSSMRLVFLSGTKVIDENGIWQYADSMKMQPTFLLEHVELVRSVLVNFAGAWNMKGRNCIFELNNWHMIDGIFKGLYLI